MVDKDKSLEGGLMSLLYRASVYIETNNWCAVLEYLDVFFGSKRLRIPSLFF
jgi:hypothetical protein